MNTNRPKIKIFFGNTYGITADQLFGEWIEDNPNVKIIVFKYQQSHCEHSIAILYEEELT